MTNGDKNPNRLKNAMGQMCSQGLLRYEGIKGDVEGLTIKPDGTAYVILRKGSTVESIPCRALKRLEKDCEHTNYKPGNEKQRPIIYLNCPEECNVGALYKKMTEKKIVKK